MKNILFTLALAALPLAGVQAAPTPTVALYDGNAATQSNVSVAAWGGGSGQEATDVTLFGGHSLKVTTLDTHQGARLTFKSPVSLAGDNRVFQVTLRRGGATLHYDPRTIPGYDPATGEAPQAGDAPGTSAFPGADGGFDPSGRGGGNFGAGGFDPSGRGGFSAGGGGGRQGRRGGFGTQNGAGTNAYSNYGRGGRGGRTETPLIPQINSVRMEFALENGKTADVYRAIPDSTDTTAGEGWYSVNVPVSALKLGGTDSPLKSMTIGGDQYGVFYIGRMKLASKTAAPSLTIDGPDKIAPGQPVTLNVKGDTDLDSFKYTWDFNSGNGQPDTAIGTIATTRYYTPNQDVTVTLTATDLDGVNAPVKVTKNIHVTEGRGPGAGYPGGPGGYPGGVDPRGGYPGAGYPPPGGGGPGNDYPGGGYVPPGGGFPGAGGPGGDYPGGSPDNGDSGL